MRKINCKRTKMKKKIKVKLVRLQNEEKISELAVITQGKEGPPLKRKLSRILLICWKERVLQREAEHQVFAKLSSRAKFILYAC